MGRRRKIDKLDKPEDQASLKGNTLGWIQSVAFIVLFAFFILASVDKAGFVGNKVFNILSILFGVGYFVIPAICIIMAISLAQSIKKDFGYLRISGSVVLFLSLIVIIEIIFDQRGGIVGNVLEKPLMIMFDVYASMVILVGLSIIGIMTSIDQPINLNFLHKFRKQEENNNTVIKEKEIKISGAELNDADKTIQPKTAMPVNNLAKKMPDQNDTDEFKLDKNNFSFKEWTPPPLSMLERDRGKPEVGDIKANANIIKRTLQNFGIIVEMDEISIGPSVTRYALKPAEGVKLSKILGLQNNLELALAAHPVRIEAPIPGKSLVGIEIPNSVKTTVGLATLLSQPEYTESSKPLMISLGKGISGVAHFANLAKMPHLLIAGATGSGKSVSIHAIINSMLFRNPPENLKFIMIDPKRVELTLYNKIPHLFTPVITDAKKAILALKWAAREMDRRYGILEGHKVRDVESYHKNILAPVIEELKKSGGKNTEKKDTPDLMPYIVIVIDELADIMQAYPRELESAIVRLAQMSRAVGIHLILSTQRPSVNVITGLIKANIPARIALQVSSQFDSRTILDGAGAEKLLGAGDMLYLSGEMSKPIRLQSPFISESEVKRVTEYLGKQNEDELPEEINLTTTTENKNPIFNTDNDEDVDDDRYEEAREVVIMTSKASTSYLQRKLGVGYARAARLMDILEEKGVVGRGEGSKPREVLIKPDGGILPQTDDDLSQTSDISIT
ncbi:MAG: DNA translocase FtsK [Patescibacteria group bacterium]